MTLQQRLNSDKPITPELLEQVVLGGDLEKLTPAQRLDYYRRVCDSLGVNPLTKPFQYIKLNGKLTLYASRDATDQLRNRHKISVEIVGAPQIVNDVYIVTARATTPEGRSDTEIGAVTISALKGEALANAMMKAMTKAKRRVTLSIVGLGWLDETEVETIPDARPLVVDHETGEIQETTPAGTYVVKATVAQQAEIKSLAESWGKDDLKALLTEHFPQAITPQGWNPRNLSTILAHDLIVVLRGDAEPESQQALEIP